MNKVAPIRRVMTTSAKKGSQSLANLRRRMFDADPRCYWCRRATEWATPATGALPDEAATLDHLRSRNFRGEARRVEVVVACYGCNQERNREETAALLDERRKRYGRATAER